MAIYKLSEQIKEVESSLNHNQKRELKWLCERFPESLDEEQLAKFKQDISALASGKPLAYILGDIPFYGVSLKLNEDVLIPRPETELLVDKIVKRWKAWTDTASKKQVAESLREHGKPLLDSDFRVLDLCSGSGAIAIALQKALGCQVDAVEISPKLCSLIEENAQSNGASVKVIQSDMFQKATGKYHLIVSNPPYIATDKITELEHSVRDFEPHLALDGGADGLDFYRKIAKKAPLFLEKYGKIALEIGCDQKDEVSKLLEDSFEDIEIMEDYSGLPRFILARLR